MNGERRYILHWSDEAIATGRTLNDEQREAAIRQADALRQDPIAWMTNFTYWGQTPAGRKIWHIPGATVQLIFYVERGEVFIFRIGTEDIPPLDERD